MKRLIDILANNNLLNGVDYENSDINFPKISEFLNKNAIDYINNIKKYESQGITKLEENEKAITFRNLSYQ